MCVFRPAMVLLNGALHCIIMNIKTRNFCKSAMLKDNRILKLIFTIFASYLILDTFYTLLVRKPTFTSNERRPLNEEDFPQIIFCPQPSIDVNALNANGYPGADVYFRGLTKNADNMNGWAGNKSEDIKKLSLEISSLKSVDECGPKRKPRLDRINSANVSRINFNLTNALSPFHICCKVIPPKEAFNYPLQYLSVSPLHNSLIESYKVFLTDYLSTSIFDQYQTVMLGDEIISSNNGRMHYKVKVWEEIHLEGDPNYPCIDYKVSGEYAKCVENEMVKENLKFLNCTPPWMTINEDQWCKGKLEFNSSLNKQMFITFLAKIGTIVAKYEKCEVPCRVKRYQIKKLGIRKWSKGDKEGLSLWFENEVDVTKSLWKIDEKTFISNVGGFIGIGKEFLWLTVFPLTSVYALISILKVKKENVINT